MCFLTWIEGTLSFNDTSCLLLFMMQVTFLSSLMKKSLQLLHSKFEFIVCYNCMLTASILFSSLIVACEAATNCSGHETCRGSGSSWNCCTVQSKCGIHEGDCDSDEECEGTLTCGIGNCAVHLFPENADCCQEPGNQSNVP